MRESEGKFLANDQRTEIAVNISCRKQLVVAKLTLRAEIDHVRVFKLDADLVYLTKTVCVI